MRFSILLPSFLFPTLLLTGVAAGCSSSSAGGGSPGADAAVADSGSGADSGPVVGPSDSGPSPVDSGPTNPPLDSGPVPIVDSGPSPTPEAGTAVTIVIDGYGIVVSADAVPNDAGANGYVGADGGSPIVDCPSSCSAPRGVAVYAIPDPGSSFVSWSAGGSTISTADSLEISASVGSPLTATFSFAQ